MYIKSSVYVCHEIQCLINSDIKYQIKSRKFLNIYNVLFLEIFFYLSSLKYEVYTSKRINQSRAINMGAIILKRAKYNDF